MKYFQNCQTIDEAKNLFRKLCLKLHPDKGGNETEFIQMYKEFENFKPSTKKENESFNAEEFYNIIQHFENLEGLNISFVGSFIWIEGNTFNLRDQIKNILLEGYKPPTWAKSKKAWFFSPLEYKKKTGKTFDLETIKNKYGCQSYKTKSSLKLAY